MVSNVSFRRVCRSLRQVALCLVHGRYGVPSFLRDFHGRSQIVISFAPRAGRSSTWYLTDDDAYFLDGNILEVEQGSQVVRLALIPVAATARPQTDSWTH